MLIAAILSEYYVIAVIIVYALKDAIIISI